VPSTETPKRLTVILLVPAGMPVKSIAVPLVEACSVPRVIPPLLTTPVPSAFV
jgi:hypothetical protein